MARDRAGLPGRKELSYRRLKDEAWNLSRLKVTVERYESGKSYFRTFYPEYEWVSCINMKKIFEYFNIVKSVSTLVYDAISVTIRKNPDQYRQEKGYFYYVDEDFTYLWEYFIENNLVLKIDNKVRHNLVSKVESEGFLDKLDLLGQEYPIFEVATLTKFPLDSTLLPIFKKKVLSHIIHKSSFINQTNSDVIH